MPANLRSLLIALVIAMFAVMPAQAARQALVIGNAAYTEGALKNPVNDARAMDGKLTALGFKVMKVENLKRQQIGRTLTAFANTLKPGDEVVVFYAGHGVQVKGINYLPTVDADIQSEEDVALNSLNLNTLMERLDEAKAGLKLLFLDACRNNPYARSLRSNDRGLARVSAAPSGTLIHFATRPGSVAADGTGSNGLYTSQLLRFIDSPDVPVETMLKRVSAAVTTESKKQQEPWTEGSIVGEFYFKAGAVATTVKPEPADSAAQVEQQGWAAAQGGNAEAGYAAYLREYPQGRYAAAARIALASLQGKAAADKAAGDKQAADKIAADKATADRATAAKVLADKATADKIASDKLAADKLAADKTAAEKRVLPVAAGQLIKDCADCPEMVGIPAGSFDMGSTESADEQPVRRVNVSAFLLGRTEVTQRQWIAVMGSNPSRFSSCGLDCPVEGISWEDSQEFIRRLGQGTGKAYRLPTEAEWEYAARAGNSGKWSFGDVESQLGNHAWFSMNSGATTHIVAQKRPNAFGLYDMHGNAWEWVQDTWHGDYTGAPSDGSAWINGGDNARRVLRGGAYVNYSAHLRSAIRGRVAPDVRADYSGLRIARTL
jgi:formylglycine-generating enzyme required for sulfatase activity